MHSNAPIGELIEFLGFAPDMDPATPGVFIDCQNVVPNHRGWQTPLTYRDRPDVGYTTAGSGTVVSTGAFDEFSDVSAGGLALQGVYASDYSTQAIYAVGKTGADRRIMRASPGNAFEDVTGDTAGYGGSSNISFVDFGGYVVMGGAGDGSAGGTGGLKAAENANATDFSAIDGTTSYQFLAAAEGFVLGFEGTQLGVSGTTTGRWGCSARYDHTNWSVAPATLANTGVLVDEFGSFTGVGVIGNQVLAFKRGTAYIGSFVGAPEVWRWEEWPHKVGTHLPPLKYRDTLIFISEGDIYQTDGVTIRSLTKRPDGTSVINKHLFNRADPLFNSGNGAGPIVDNAMDFAVDEQSDLLYLRAYHRGYGSVYADLTTYVCHIPSLRWGKAYFYDADFFFQARIPAGNGAQGPDQYSARTLWAAKTATKTLHALRWPYSADSSSDHTIAPFFTTFDFGDDFEDVEYGSVRLRFLTGPASATMRPYFRNNLDDALQTATPVARSADGDFNFQQNARWHRLRFDLTNATATTTELTGLRFDPEARAIR